MRPLVEQMTAMRTCRFVVTCWVITGAPYCGKATFGVTADVFFDSVPFLSLFAGAADVGLKLQDDALAGATSDITETGCLREIVFGRPQLAGWAGRLDSEIPLRCVMTARWLRSRSFVAALFCLAGTGLLMVHVHDRATRWKVMAADDAHGGMAHMAGHMYMTSLRPMQPGDQQKADAVAAAAKQAMAPYQDYKKALDDGYVIFLPNVPQHIYHFTKREYGFEARYHFDPLKPTSLLYKKTPDGGYKLVGAMYTDRVDATEDELNERIPMSIARWHQHINFCKAPEGQKAAYFGPDAKFGLLGSITTKEACEAAGGEFHPHIFGWMVHVYPYETNAKNIWAIDDDEGHDSMRHSAMPGMQMKD